MKQSKNKKWNFLNNPMGLVVALLLGILIGNSTASIYDRTISGVKNNTVGAVDVDNVLPQVAVTYPTSKTKIVPGSIVNIVASASDNVGIQAVDIHVSTVTKTRGGSGGVGSSDGVLINRIHQCIDESSPYNCSWTVPNDRNVVYLIEAVAQDTSGNRAISKYIEFTVR